MSLTRIRSIDHGVASIEVHPRVRGCGIYEDAMNWDCQPLLPALPKKVTPPTPPTISKSMMDSCCSDFNEPSRRYPGMYLNISIELQFPHPCVSFHFSSAIWITSNTFILSRSCTQIQQKKQGIKSRKSPEPTDMKPANTELVLSV
jgi:hypothetical protein